MAFKSILKAFGGGGEVWDATLPSWTSKREAGGGSAQVAQQEWKLGRVSRLLKRLIEKRDKTVPCPKRFTV